MKYRVISNLTNKITKKVMPAIYLDYTVYLSVCGSGSQTVSPLLSSVHGVPFPKVKKFSKIQYQELRNEVIDMIILLILL